MVYAHGPMLKWRNLFHSRFKKFKDNILSVKRNTKFNASFFRIKLYTLQISTTKNLKKKKKKKKKKKSIWKKQYQELKFHIVDVSNRIIRLLFNIQSKNLISNNTSKNTNSVNLSSTNLANVINGNHELNASNISNINSQNLISYSNTGKFSFCLSWNTNGWNCVKRDSIEYFNTIFKLLFLCFSGNV